MAHSLHCQLKQKFNIVKILILSKMPPFSPISLLVLVLTLHGLVHQVTSVLPTDCRTDSTCGSFAVCYGYTCRCRLGALPKESPNELGCQYKECSYSTEECLKDFPDTKCDYNTQTCVCAYGYELDSSKQTCKYNPSGNKDYSISAWVWLGPVLGMVVIFGSIFGVAYYRRRMIRKMVENGQIVITPMVPVVVGAIITENDGQRQQQQHSNAPPAYSQ